MFVLDYALPNCLALDRANKEWARKSRPPFYFFKIASVKQIPAPNHSIVIGSPETKGLRLIVAIMLLTRPIYQLRYILCIRANRLQSLCNLLILHICSTGALRLGG